MSTIHPLFDILFCLPIYLFRCFANVHDYRKKYVINAGFNLFFDLWTIVKTHSGLSENLLRAPDEPTAKMQQ
ncbi:hypothetical protein JCM15548_12670 [Geofilum rubicundum JCM 15548]|uniref:Uncharacterized protein n=1 Tax=Geofilum rubicundum JCM 15548 TaxID=1236989 RepID=A0A0E9LZX8_9BACT|nr:hypothetical protein JCM15548_12670 [Geofilum rubicundum JCM 15548]